MTNKCKCCGRTQDLRLGVCFDCADAESVIAEGTDMYDNEVHKQEGMSTALSRLQYILKKFGVAPNQ
jgi:hypothetical protein